MTAEEREELAQCLAGSVAPHLATAVHDGDAAKVAELLRPLDRQQLLALAVVLASRVPQPRTRPDDGHVDEIAVRRAINGEAIALTRAEREEAVRVMAASGAAVNTIGRRLHMSGERVERILGQEGVA